MWNSHDSYLWNILKLANFVKGIKALKVNSLNGNEEYNMRGLRTREQEMLKRNGGNILKIVYEQQ